MKEVLALVLFAENIQFHKSINVRKRADDLDAQQTSCLYQFAVELGDYAATLAPLTVYTSKSEADRDSFFIRAAMKHQRVCVSLLRGRYVGIYGTIPKEIVYLQIGNSSKNHFGLCAPTNCSDSSVVEYLAPLALQYKFDLPGLPALSAQGSDDAPLVEEMSTWSEVAVDFAIAGFGKCGTTTLAAYLNRHPKLSLADVGQTHLSENEFFLNGQELLPTLSRVREFRARHLSDSNVLVGIKDANLMFRDLALLKLRSGNPSIRIIVLIRDPIDWMESTYRFYTLLDHARPSFREHALGINSSLNLRHHGIEMFFSHWIRRLLTLGFTRQQLYVIHVHALNVEDDTNLNHLLRTLGVHHHPLGIPPRSNANLRDEFDLCREIQIDSEVRDVFRELKRKLTTEYLELQRLLEENGQAVPLELRRQESRCERTRYGIPG